MGPVLEHVVALWCVHVSLFLLGGAGVGVPHVVFAVLLAIFFGPLVVCFTFWPGLLLETGGSHTVIVEVPSLGQEGGCGEREHVVPIGKGCICGSPAL